MPPFLINMNVIYKIGFSKFNIRRIIDIFAKHIKETLIETAGNFQWRFFSN